MVSMSSSSKLPSHAPLESSNRGIHVPPCKHGSEVHSSSKTVVLSVKVVRVAGVVTVVVRVVLASFAAVNAGDVDMNVVGKELGVSVGGTVAKVGATDGNTVGNELGVWVGGIVVSAG